MELLPFLNISFKTSRIKNKPIKFNNVPYRGRKGYIVLMVPPNTPPYIKRKKPAVCFDVLTNKTNIIIAHTLGVVYPIYNPKVRRQSKV